MGGELTCTRPSPQVALRKASASGARAAALLEAAAASNEAAAGGVEGGGARRAAQLRGSDSTLADELGIEEECRVLEEAAG